jgi:predicted dehydrogenase
MGRRHIHAAARAGVKLSGIADTFPEARAKALAESGLPEAAAFADPLALLDRIRPECVIVSTTTDSHCDLVCAALAAGARYVLCEKPMAASLEQCDRMLAAAAKTGARLAVNHPMRFQELYRTVKTLLAAPEFGGATSMAVVGGNIGIAMNGCHLIEGFRFVTGEDIHEVSAWLQQPTEPNPRGARFQDRAGAIRGTTATGKRFYLEAGGDQGHGLVMTCGARFGQIVAETLTGTLHLRRRSAESRGLPLTRYYAAPVHEELLRVEPSDALADAASVLRALLSGAGFPDGATGRANVEVLVKAYLSQENGNRPVVDARPAYDRVFPWA